MGEKNQKLVQRYGREAVFDRVLAAVTMEKVREYTPVSEETLLI
jgi:hypothetical protein